MKVGDLVTLSAKGKQLYWVKAQATLSNQKLLYGIIIESKKMGQMTFYVVQWFFDGGDQNKSTRLQRFHLKQLK